MNKICGSASGTSMPAYESWRKIDLVRRIRVLEGTASADDMEQVKKKVTTPNGKKSKAFDFSKHPRRFIALKFAYMGWNYNGLNFQYDPTPLPTVEEVILQALAKAKLVAEADPVKCNFSRCGRTDKGVSALNQVISLEVRLALPEAEQNNRENDNRELPYLSILNLLLPQDIRMTAVCLRPPPGFDSRFSCLYRHYKYVFSGSGLDIDKMNEAAKLFVGEHDFRNFCKVDGSKQITNHVRTILSAQVLPQQGGFFVFDLKGTAFLWHQVRCMMGILFLVGQQLELPDLVTELLNVEKFPGRPHYDMAYDVPLVLYDCVFPDMEWIKQSEFDENQQRKFAKEYLRFRGTLINHQVKAQIAGMMGGVFMSDNIDHAIGGVVNTGDGSGKNFNTYIPVAQRVVGDSPDTINEKYLEKKKRRLED